MCVVIMPIEEKKKKKKEEVKYNNMPANYVCNCSHKLCLLLLLLLLA